jgi:hypothetical protein
MDAIPIPGRMACDQPSDRVWMGLRSVDFAFGSDPETWAHQRPTEVPEAAKTQVSEPEASGSNKGS